VKSDIASKAAEDFSGLARAIDELAELYGQLRKETETHKDLLSLNREIEQKMSNLQDLARNLVTSHNLADKLNWEEAKVKYRVDDPTRDEIKNFVLNSYGRYRPETSVKLKDESRFCYRVLYDALEPGLGYSAPGGSFERYLIEWLQRFHESRSYYIPQTVDEKSAFSDLIETFYSRTKHRRRLLRFYSTDSLLCDPVSLVDEADKVLILYQTPLTIFVRPKDDDLFKNSFSPEISLLKKHSDHVDQLFAPLLDAPETDEFGNKYRGMVNFELKYRPFKCVARNIDGKATFTGHYDGERWVIVDRGEDK
jgi:hypothetical protein